MSAKGTCEVTHVQISKGTCPWCGCRLGKDDSASGGKTSISQEQHWNVAAMSAALDDKDIEIRSLTVSNLLNRHGPAAEVAVPLLSQAVDDSSDRVCTLAERALVKLGRELTPQEAVRFETQLSKSEYELATRILLLGYYFLRQQESRSAWAARREHVLWLIKHAPESRTAGDPDAYLLEDEDAESYGIAKQLWLDHIRANPRNTRILGNAANFFLLSDRELSEDLLKQARVLEPSNPRWPERLGQLYSLRSINDEPGQLSNAISSLRELQAAEEVRLGIPWHAETEDRTEKSERDIAESLLSRIHSLPDLAKAAFEAGQFDEAHEYASELLEIARSENVPEFFRDDGNAIHHGNLVLGRCALKKGDVEHAKQHLIAAGKTKGSPQLGSFGPNMALAKELLEHGQREAVLEFFQLCGQFWKTGGSYLHRWTDQVKSGEIPKFGANLHY